MTLFFSAFALNAQVSDYVFSQSTTTYEPISGTPFLVNTDFGNSAVQNIGFTFVFNSTPFTQFVVSADGSIRLGSANPTSGSSPLSTTSNTNAIAAFARDGRSFGGVVIGTIGTAPNRVCVIQYNQYQVQWNAATETVNMQILLYETTNVVQIKYNNAAGSTTARAGQVGLRGSNATNDFINRTTTTNWGATTAGTANNNTVTYSSTVLPSNGLTFSFTPPVFTTPPNCIASPTAPTNNQLNVINSTFTWPVATGGPTGYKFSLGTNPEGNNIISNQDLGSVTTHNIGSGILLPSTQYFWSITPYSENGDASACTIWTFTSASAPNCATNLLPANNATNVAINPTLSWTAPTNPVATSYDLFIGLTESSLTLVGNVTATSVAITPPFPANTVIFWRVVPKNAMGDAVGCAVNSFTTGSSLAYCPSTGTSSNTQITNVTITGISALNNTTAGNAGYADFTSLTPTVSAFAGGQVNFSVTATSDPGRSIFVDWNNNGIFDLPGERVFTTGAYATGASVGSFTVPLGTPTGNYRIRVVVDWNALTPAPCNTSINGETEDYTLIVVAAPSCLAPSGLTFSQASLTSANVSWVASTSTNVGYEWAVTTSSTPPTSGNATTELTALATGLTPNATNFLHVRTNCGNGDFSTWASLSFVVGYCSPTYSFGKTDGDLISNISISGTTLANNSGSAAINPAYTFFTGAPNLTAELRQGTTYNVNVTVGTWGNQHIRAWIDFNEDGVFSNDEAIGSAVIAPGQGNAGPFPPATFTITLTNNSPLGTKRMRVRSVYNTLPAFFQTIDPCIEYGFGETEDYDITILEAITSQIVAQDCGQTISDVANVSFNATPVAGAQGYVFRIQAGTYTQTFTTTTPSAKFTDFAGFTYGTTYNVSVAVQANDATGPFGASCQIATAAINTVIKPEHCGTTVLNTQWERIYAENYPGATQWIFKIDNGTQSFEVTRNVDFVHFFDFMPNIAYGTTYQVSVSAVILGGTTGFGPSCPISITGSPKTSLAPAFCNATLPSINTNMSLRAVDLAMGYRIYVKNMTSGNTQSIVKMGNTSESRRVRISDFSNSALGTTFKVWAEVTLDGTNFITVLETDPEVCEVTTPTPPIPTTQMVRCGTTLPGMNVNLTAAWVSDLVQEWNYVVVDANDNTLSQVTKSTNGVQLSEFSGLPITGGTGYRIKVRVRMYNTWGNFGTTCIITTPGFAPGATLPTTQLQASRCNTVIPGMNVILRAAWVSDQVTSHTFALVDANNNILSEVERPNNDLILSQFPGVTIVTGTVYRIRVKVRINNEWSAYGNVCTITTPGVAPGFVVPTTTLSENVCNSTLFPWSEIFANPVANATAYRFRFTEGDSTPAQVFEMPTNVITLFDTTLPFTGMFSVDVAVQVQGTWGAYGAACDLFFMEMTDFMETNSPVNSSVVGFPNPFSQDFMLKVNTQKPTDLVVSIYDMTGKLVEVKRYNSQMGTLSFGHQLPAGVYNVTVVGGEIQETIKMVKK